jgi:23S rRNA (uracil1939-C5)-methyltransferase
MPNSTTARRRRSSRPVLSRGKSGRGDASGPVIELTIEDMGARGDGIARHGDARVFVPLTLPGEQVRARLGPRRADGIAAELIEIVAPSAARQAPPCPHFGACGGCQLQHMTAAAQAAWKTAEIAGALARRGINDVTMRPIMTMPPATRRRTHLIAERRGDEVLLGYHTRSSHAIVDVATCAVLDTSLTRLLPQLRGLARSLLPRGGSCGLHLTAADSGIDLTIDGLAIPDLAHRETLAHFAQQHDLARASWSIGGRLEPIAERRPVTIRFGDASVPLPPLAFLQATRGGEAAIVSTVLDALGTHQRVADLFSGLGTLTFPVARSAQVHAVDGDREAIAALAAAARRPEFAGRVTWSERNLAHDPLTPVELARFDAVIFDPPRSGARAQSEAVGESVIKNAVAVSCNPSTFARDARILIERGFALDWVQPIDQFVWSSRIELVARFSRAIS